MALEDKVITILSNEQPWGPIIPITEKVRPVLPLEEDMMPTALQAYTRDVADRQQCPVEFVAVTAICSLASVLGVKATVFPKQHDDWAVTPTQWGMIVGRPSAMKSPAMNAALRPLFSLEEEQRKTHASLSEDEAAEQILQKAGRDDTMKSVKKALKDGDQQRAFELAKSVIPKEETASRRRYKVNDATVEKLGELLNENSNGLLLVRDELTGWLSKLQKEEFQGDRAFYLEAWEGRSQFTYDRIGRGTVDIANCTISAIGGIQPSKLAPLVRGAKAGVTDDGLVQRLQLAVMPDDIHDWEWRDRAPNGEAYAAYERVFEKLNDMPFDIDNPLELRFSENAQSMYIEWTTELQTEARKNSDHPAFESHLLKMPKCISGLALLFELIDAEDVPEVVGEQATAQALEWADFLKSHARRIYDLGIAHDSVNALLILSRREKLPENFTARQVARKHWAGLDLPDAVSGALELLIDHNYLRETRIDTGGRPSFEYTWNSALSVRTS